MPGLENLLAGKTLVKRYRIDEVIGLGGFAAVYRAEDLRLGRPVAVKVITLAPPDAGMRERLRERFEREARAAASLPHHPNVITVHDFGTDPELGLDFLVMELLQGENLAQLFTREGRPGTDVALQILREAAEGVAVGHASGIIHRDVKPGNIFLAEPHGDDPFRVCVLDFGIARIATDDSELTRTLAGENPLTAAYAAPEQVRGDHHLTPAADVFSLGVVGYQLLTGEKPFAVGEGRRARGRDPVRPLHEAAPTAPESVAAVIEKAMAEEPGDRYPDAGAFAHALDAAKSDDDRTIIAPAGGFPAATGAAAVVTRIEAADDDEGTILHPGPPPAAPAPVAPRPVPAPEPVAASPRLSTVSTTRRRKPAGLLLLVPLLLAIAAAVYAFSRGGGGSDRPVRSGPWADTLPDTTTSAESPETPVAPPPASTGAPVEPQPGAVPPSAPPSETSPSAPPPVQIQPTPGIAPEPSPAPPPVSPSPAPPPVFRPPAPRPSPPPAPRPSPPPAPRPSPPPAPRPSPPPAPAPAPPPAPTPTPTPVEPIPTPLPVPPAPRDTIVIPPAPPPPPPGE
jgi:serine/threonine protein kinase